MPDGTARTFVRIEGLKRYFDVSPSALERLLQRRERLWVIAVPFGLYVLWYACYGTNRAGVHDFLVGSPGGDPAHAGHADLYSGKTGGLLHRFDGATAGDSFGWAVSSAGDVNHDGRPDIVVGAPQFWTGAGPGFAYIYSGRTYDLIRTLSGDVTGDQLGSGTGWTRDINHDGVPDQIIGARDAGEGASRRPRTAGCPFGRADRARARARLLEPQPLHRAVPERVRRLPFPGARRTPDPTPPRGSAARLASRGRRSTSHGR